MTRTHPNYRRFKQIVEAGITVSSDETFVQSKARFLQLADLTEGDFDLIEQLNDEEKAYVIERQGTEVVFRRPPEPEAEPEAP